MELGQILSWVVGAVGLTGFYFAGKRVWWSWYINLFCQVLWSTYALVTGQPAFLVTAAVYSVIFGINAWKWTKDHRNVKQLLASESTDSKGIYASRFYRKKPIVVEAMQIDFHDNVVIHEIQKWAGDLVCFFNYDPMTNHFYAAKVETLEGIMSALEGDYIIRGVNGEFYPCKADIFEKTYEKVGDLADVSKS